jgi:hypothetical protein
MVLTRFIAFDRHIIFHFWFVSALADHVPDSASQNDNSPEYPKLASLLFSFRLFPFALLQNVRLGFLVSKLDKEKVTDSLELLAQSI